jgi:hypothetical protein
MVRKYNEGVAESNRQRKKHGGAVNARQGKANPLYHLWRGIKDRCLNPKSKHYHRYGGRGITMHQAWVDDYAVFATYVGAQPDGMTLDRIDNNGNYEPNNVRWATRKEQANNRVTNTIVEHDGKAMTLSQWADHFGLPYVVINSRWKKGEQPPELFEPRRTKLRDSLVEFRGERRTLAEWAKVLNVPYPTIHWRWKNRRDLL